MLLKLSRSVRQNKIRRDQNIQDVLVIEFLAFLNDLLFLFLVEKVMGLVVDEGVDHVDISSFTSDEKWRKISVA